MDFDIIGEIGGLMCVGFVILAMIFRAIGSKRMEQDNDQ